MRLGIAEETAIGGTFGRSGHAGAARLWCLPGRVPHGVLACEHALTPDGIVEVEVAPAADRPVDTAPRYSDGRCAPG
jgi:hypothetical protein